MTHENPRPDSASNKSFTPIAGGAKYESNFSGQVVVFGVAATAVLLCLTMGFMAPDLPASLILDDASGTPPIQPGTSEPNVPLRGAAGQRAPHKMATEDVVAQAEKSVAYIRGRTSAGTGFLVQSKLLVTNKHVIAQEHIEDLKVHFPSAVGVDRGPFDVKLVFEDPSLDLALLRVETTLDPLALAKDYQFRRGEEVIVMGNPSVVTDVQTDLTLQNAVSKGVMSTEVKIKGLPYYQLGISINPGNSGGPVFDLTGQVIGVVTLKANNKEGLGFCIPLFQLHQTIKMAARFSDADYGISQSTHRLRLVFSYAFVTGELHKITMKGYAGALQTANESQLSSRLVLNLYRRELEPKLANLDRLMPSDLKNNVAKICSDPNLSELLRETFVDYWANYLEMKSYVNDPRGTSSSYQSKFHELSDKHDRLSNSLKLLLGITPD